MLDSPQITVLLPVFNDWDVAGILIADLDATLQRQNLTARILLVDDGSTVVAPDDFFNNPSDGISEVLLLRLRRNLGHQRAIAVGLAFAFEELHPEIVIIMDADGEDRPEDLPRLLAKLQETNHSKIVFAERTKRCEALWFRFLYQVYRLVHRALTGISVKVGNYSAVPLSCLSSLVVVSELWNHYAAGVFKSRIPYTSIPTERGHRIAGRSKMNFVDLVTHGLSAISVFGETVGVRLLLVSSLLTLGLLGILTAFGVASVLIESLAPGWALLATAGAVLIACWQILTISFGALFFVLYARDRYSFIPLRDYQFFIENVKTLPEKS